MIKANCNFSEIKIQYLIVIELEDYLPILLFYGFQLENGNSMKILLT